MRRPTEQLSFFLYAIIAVVLFLRNRFVRVCLCETRQKQTQICHCFLQKTYFFSVFRQNRLLCLRRQEGYYHTRADQNSTDYERWRDHLMQKQHAHDCRYQRLQRVKHGAGAGIRAAGSYSSRCAPPRFQTLPQTGRHRALPPSDGFSSQTRSRSRPPEC